MHYLQYGSDSMPDIPKNAGLSPATTKNLHLAVLSLCPNITVNSLLFNIRLILCFNTIEL